jgi:tetratricopeptide (TPR) repeat protein
MHLLCEDIYQRADTEGHDSVAAVALLGMSSASLATGDCYRSETYTRRALVLAERAQEDRVICDVLVELGELEITLNQHYTTAQQYLERALTLARRTQYTEGIAAALRGIGMNHLQQQQMQAAHARLTQSLAHALLTASKPLQALSANALGNWCLINHHPDQAIISFRKALEYCRETGDRINEAAILANLGRTYAQYNTTSAYHIAFDFFAQALELTRTLHFAYGEITVLNTMGWAYQSYRQSERALNCFLLASERALEGENEALIEMALEQLMCMSHEAGEPEQALLVSPSRMPFVEQMGNYTQLFTRPWATFIGCGMPG